MTTDTGAALQFYQAVTGWEAQKWGDGADYTILKANGSQIGGVMPMMGGASGASPRWIAYVEVPNIDDTATLAPTLGGNIGMGPHSAEGVGRFAAFTDPQGAIFAAITSQNRTTPETDPKRGEFSWHELLTTDYKSADAFYNKLFGWEKKSEFDMGPMGTYYMFGRDRFTYGGMFNKPSSVAAPPHWLHYVHVDSADAAAERATKAGGTVINGPMEVPGGDRIAAIVDPQGAPFAVHSKPNS
jgi:hypothetical protein